MHCQISAGIQDMSQQEYNVESTAEVIDAMAASLEQSARELRAIAKGMREERTFDGAHDALQVFGQLTAGMRPELLFKRPMRAVERAHQATETAAE